LGRDIPRLDRLVPLRPRGSEKYRNSFPETPAGEQNKGDKDWVWVSVPGFGPDNQ